MTDSRLMHPCQKTGLARPTSGRCVHEACRPAGKPGGWPCMARPGDRCTHSGCDPHPEGAALMTQPLPQYTATLTIQRDDAEGEVIVRGVVTGTAAIVSSVACSLADAFKDEVER